MHPITTTNSFLFPLSDQLGSDMSAINSTLIQQLAQNDPPLPKEELEQIIKEHLVFLMSGGAGGHWKTILIKGLVLGIYRGPEGKEGKQASFEKRHLDAAIELSSLELPFANFCGVFAPQVSFFNADLSHCLLTDATLENANFQKSNLHNSDFSRANLAGASFVNSDCSGADFENCNLTGADFRGARLNGARFPGAQLDQVVY